MGYKNVIVAFHSCFNRLKAGGFRMMHAGMQLACIVMSLHFGSPFFIFGLKPGSISSFKDHSNFLSCNGPYILPKFW